MTAVGPYSRHARLSKQDGRTREARLVKSLREELNAHVGGKPSVTEELLISQACDLQLRIAVMNRKFMATGVFTEHDSRTFLAWNNSLARLLRQLGLKPAKTQTLSPVEAMKPIRLPPIGEVAA
jgi:hypothetical protein